jgi:altronate hydrolase
VTADPAMLLHRSDDVAIARAALTPGAKVQRGNVAVIQAIPAGHKVAIRAIAAGDAVRRYGQIIGFATCAIRAGEHVHVHNLGMGAFDKDYAFGADVRPSEPEHNAATFEGIVRADGRIATRNYIGILTTVNCSATVAKGIAAHFDATRLADFPDIDGVVALTHPMGCCIDVAGAGMRLLQRTLAGYAQHPNFGGLLIVGLGCEANQIARLLENHSLRETDVCRTFAIQDVGGSTKAIAKGIALVQEMLPRAAKVARKPVPASHLILGLQCGGSDGYSGITANPALGAAADILVRNGGTAVLAETPEIYGAEHLLTRRAVSEEVGRKLLRLIEWWEEHARKNDGAINNNPTPGNKAGGLTTILEKSLGAVAKGGTSNLEAVYEYADPIIAKGFAFMDTPGYDPISVTGLVAGGANIVCFTTGRGSGFGCAPAPSLKLSTNTALWRRQEEDIDLNCGGILDEGLSVQEMGHRIFDLLLQTASGKKTKSELQGYGHNEFVPWFVGAVM